MWFQNNEQHEIQISLLTQEIKRFQGFDRLLGRNCMSDLLGAVARIGVLGIPTERSRDGDSSMHMLDLLPTFLTIKDIAPQKTIHTRRGLGGDNPEDINSFAVLGVSRRKT